MCWCCCGGGCGVAAGVVALSSLLFCRVVGGVVLVCGGSLPVVAVLFGAGVVGSSLAVSCAVSVGVSSSRRVVVAVAGVGFSALLLGACRPVSVGFVGWLACRCVARASLFVLAALSVLGARSVVGARPFFMCGRKK